MTPEEQQSRFSSCVCTCMSTYTHMYIHRTHAHTETKLLMVIQLYISQYIMKLHTNIDIVVSNYYWDIIPLYQTTQWMFHMNYFLVALHYFSNNGSSYFSLEEISLEVSLPNWQHFHFYTQLKFLKWWAHVEKSYHRLP